MELKQMEYLVAAVESRSLNKAAERLYTSQPNVSKVLRNLERELSVKILERTSKGVSLTNFGEQVYDYAKNMLKTAHIIEELAGNTSYDQLKVASYPSNMIARKLTQYYMDNLDSHIHIEFLSGTVEEVIEYIQSFAANLGIVYYPNHQEHTFKQILQRKNLTFYLLKHCKLCLYVGPYHPYYELKSIPYEALQNQKFIQGKRDYFSVMDHIDVLSQDAAKLNQLKHVVHTNSDHVMMNMLKHTDLCTIGLDLINIKYKEESLRKIDIEGCTECLSIGFVTRDGHILIEQENDFLGYLNELLEREVV